MEHYIHSLNLKFELLPERLYPWRWWVLGLYLVLMAFLSAGIPSFNYAWVEGELFGKNDPVQQSLDRIKDLFGGTNILGMIYQPVDGDLFSARSLGALKAVHRLLDEEAYRAQYNPENPMSRLIEVSSLINAGYTEADSEGVRFRDFIGDDLPETKHQSLKLRRQALAHPDYPRRFFSDDVEYGVVLMRTDLGAIPEETRGLEEDTDLAEGFVDNDEENGATRWRKFKKPAMWEYADFERKSWEMLRHPSIRKDLVFHHPSWGVFYQFDVWAREYQWALGVSLTFGLGLTGLLLGSLRALIWPMLIIVSSLVGVVGLAGWTGWPIDLSLFIVFGLVSVAAIADAVHVFSGYRFFMRNGSPHHVMVRMIFRKTGLACLLTSVTTSIGMFSLSFVKLKVIQSIGLLAGIGVLFAFVLTVFLLPVLMHWFPPRVKPASNPGTSLPVDGVWVQQVLKFIGGISADYPKTVIAVFICASVVFVFGIKRIEIDTVFAEYYAPESPVRRTQKLINDKFLGIGNMEILFEGGREGVFRDPKVLREIENTGLMLKARYPELVVDTYSLNNHIKETHRKLMDDSEEAYKIPDNPELVSQLLVLIESGDYEELEKLVTLDYAATRLSVQMKTIGSKRSMELLRDVQPEIERILAPLKHEYPRLKATVTGGVGTWGRVFDYISWSQINSFGLAFCIITLILTGIFGSLKTGLVAVLPNTFPALMVFGLMGWLGYKLDTTTLMTAPIVIGIAVDDTVHFLTHYRISLLQGQTISESVNSTLKEVGQAIVFTTLILMAVFASFIPVSNAGVSRFCILALLAVVSALLADLFLLPALCRKLHVAK